MLNQVHKNLRVANLQYPSINHFITWLTQTLHLCNFSRLELSAVGLGPNIIGQPKTLKAYMADAGKMKMVRLVVQGQASGNATYVYVCV